MSQHALGGSTLSQVIDAPSWPEGIVVFGCHIDFATGPNATAAVFPRIHAVSHRMKFRIKKFIRDQMGAR
jgi:hypothetical protein